MGVYKFLCRLNVYKSDRKTLCEIFLYGEENCMLNLNGVKYKDFKAVFLFSAPVASYCTALPW